MKHHKYKICTHSHKKKSLILIDMHFVFIGNWAQHQKGFLPLLKTTANPFMKKSFMNSNYKFVFTLIQQSGIQ